MLTMFCLGMDRCPSTGPLCKVHRDDFKPWIQVYQGRFNLICTKNPTTSILEYRVPLKNFLESKMSMWEDRPRTRMTTIPIQTQVSLTKIQNSDTGLHPQTLDRECDAMQIPPFHSFEGWMPSIGRPGQRTYKGEHPSIPTSPQTSIIPVLQSDNTSLQESPITRKTQTGKPNTLAQIVLGDKTHIETS
jgi:hypothetical protein